MPTAVSSSFDVAFWFIDRGRADHQQLSSLKLPRMLFLAQAYFAASTRGEHLMPSVFVVTEQGPVEPNLLRLFDNTVPAIETTTPRPASISSKPASSAIISSSSAWLPVCMPERPPVMHPARPDPSGADHSGCIL